jgi:YVTN family beta-propeller protein
LAFLVLTWGANRCSFAGGDQYDPSDMPETTPLPETPYPNDPPDLLSILQGLLSPTPVIYETRMPPEDVIDRANNSISVPCVPMVYDPSDEPSLYGNPFDIFPIVPPGVWPSPSPTAARFEPQAASDTAPTFLLSNPMPFPMRLPFHPAYSGVSAPETVPACNSSTANTVLVAEAAHNTVLFMSTCPYAALQRVSVGAGPVAVALTPDGQSAWVANGDSSNISIISIASMTVVATIPLPQFNSDPAEPNGVVFTPDGSTAYVTNHDANPGSVIYVIDVASQKLLTTIPTDGYPAAAAVTPDGSTLWVTNRADSTITIVDTLTNTVVTHVAADVPLGVAFNPTGTRAFVAEAELGSEETGYPNGYLRVFDVSSTATIARIPVGVMPHVVEVTPSGHYVFVTNVGSNSITEIGVNTSTDTYPVIQTIPQPGQHPFGLAFVN